jgi:hypothetical protein
MRKDACFYFDEQYAYLSSESIHKSGLLFMTPPFIKTKWKELSIGNKYDLLMQVIDASNDNSVYKKDINFEKEILKSFGFKSWRQFYVNAKYCNVSYNEQKKGFEFTPSEYDSLGYSHIREAIAHIDAKATKQEFIKSFEAALLLCR